MKWLMLLITVVLVFGLVGAATAGNSAQLTVNVTILGSIELGVTTADSFSLNWASNVLHTSKITAELGTDYVSGVTYQAKLARSTGSKASPAGQRTLSTDAVDMLTGIGDEDCASAIITYAVSPLKMNVLPTTVIWTITDAGGLNQGGAHYLGRHYYIREGFLDLGSR